MDACYYCRYERGGHDACCPYVARNTGEARFALAEWHRGRNDGADGMQPRNSNPIYMLGWKVGECALEEQQNGYDPRVA
jgi:hypothetical protein